MNYAIKYVQYAGGFEHNTLCLTAVSEESQDLDISARH